MNRPSAAFALWCAISCSPVIPPVASAALGPDHAISDRTGDVPCVACTAPAIQTQPSIASHGQRLLAAWNDAQGMCTGASLVGYGWSSDGGATWTDGGALPSLPTGGRFATNVVAAVNRATGDFYVCGQYQGGPPGVGLALLRGHFAGSAFVVDDLRPVVVAGTAAFTDPWIACDAAGTLLLGYTQLDAFLNQLAVQLVRSTDQGTTWSAPLAISAPEADGLAGKARVLAGLDGESYVVWSEFGDPHVAIKARRSDDGGQTFGAEAVAASFLPNTFLPAPRSRLLAAGPNAPGSYPQIHRLARCGAAIDASEGPRRGRLYVSWNAPTDWSDPPLAQGAPTPLPFGSSFATAVPFTPGATLEGGVAHSNDIKHYAFTGTRGQTLVMQNQFLSSLFFMNLYCGSDTVSALAGNRLYQSGLVFTLPSDGTYYIKMFRTDPLTDVRNYRFFTMFDAASPGEAARDHRDVLVATSDDGVAWSAPVRLNDDAPWLETRVPELVVDGQGVAHALWQSFDADPDCGAASNVHLVSSGDGGATWGASRRVSDASSSWSSSGCGSFDNHAEYHGVAAEGSALHLAWTDSRAGDPDVFGESLSLSSARLCPDAAVLNGGGETMLTFRVTNTGSVPGTFGWTVEDDHGWILEAAPAASGEVALLPGGFQEVQARLVVSSSCEPAAVDAVRFITRDLAIPGRVDVCSTSITCSPTTGVVPSASLSFAAPYPNPSRGTFRFAFSLPRAGRASLTLYDTDGRRVRVLADGTLDAGPHERLWDGRDQGGRRVGAGLYFAALEVDGRRLERRVNLVP